jgi:lipopolysaccharide transport system ATP-binding protein
MSNEVAIRVEGLGKRYQLGQTLKFTRNFRETLATLPRLLRQRASGAANRLLTPRPGSAAPGEAPDPETPPGTFWALRDVGFEVKSGEAVGIIGRNGAGKSTLLKILSRITAPTKGEAMLRGRLSSLLEVGTGFHPELTGRENIFLNGAILGMSRAEIRAKLDEIVAFAEVEKFLDTPVKRYSSGMYVRLAFAVAAHLEPEILIVDEVLSVGDAEFQKKCLGKMESATGGGRTVLFVSHNMQAVKRLCSRAVLLRDGRVAQIGEAGAVVEAYLRSGAHVTANIEIPPEMHRTYPPDLEVFRVEILNSRGEPTSTLLVDETFTVRLHCAVRRSEQTYRLGIGFRSADGARLANVVYGYGLGKPVGGREGDKRCLAAVTQNIFMPGSYTLDISVKNSAGGWVDFIEGIQFDVAPVSALAAQIPTGGHVKLDVDWNEAETPGAVAAG